MKGRSFKRWGWLALLAIVLPIPCWLGLALLLGSIPANPAPPDLGPDAIEIALVSNGWHVDLILPAQAGGIDWRQDFPATDTRLDAAMPFIALGWGDRDFYLETPRLRDLKARTALNALLGRGAAVMHVAHLPGMPHGAQTRRWKMAPKAYQHLAARLRDDLQRDESGKSIPIIGEGFGNADAFYEAKGHYSPITTCNEWLAAHLRAAGLPAGLWSPLPSSLIEAGWR